MKNARYNLSCSLKIFNMNGKNFSSMLFWVLTFMLVILATVTCSFFQSLVGLEKSPTPTVNLTREAFLSPIEQTGAARRTQYQLATSWANEHPGIIAATATSRAATGIVFTRSASTALSEKNDRDLIRTARAIEMANLAETLFQEGLVGSIKGSHHRLSNYTDTWAEPGVFRKHRTGFAPENFIFRADLSYTASSKETSLSEAGCGFLFAERLYLLGIRDYRIFFTLDGNLHLVRRLGNDESVQVRSALDRITLPSGGFNVVLVVYNRRVIFFINEIKVLDAIIRGNLEGDLYFLLLSGSDKTFGMNCRMSEIDLWIFD